MSGMTTTNLQDNEIVKASDLQLGGDSGIDNLSYLFKTITNCKNNVILGGKLKSDKTVSGLRAKMEPIVGYHQENEKMFFDHKGQVYMEGEIEPTNNISFANADTQNRIDTVEVKADVITAVEQSRQFYDPDTESTSYSQVDVEKRQILRLKVKKGESGTNIAPETDEGYVKIAEVFIPANATQLEDENIYNVTADIDGMENSNWTNEKTATVNPGRTQDNKDIFRKIHNSDGSLKDSVIKAAKIALTGEGCLKGEAIQKGGVAKTLITGVSINPSDSLSTNIEAIADFLTPNPQDITKTIFNHIYRIGYIIETTKNENPGTIYGGTWEAYGQGRVLVGAGTGTDKNNVEKTFTAGSEDGEFSHSLSIAELASHNHSFSKEITTPSTGAHTHPLSGTATTTNSAHKHNLSNIYVPSSFGQGSSYRSVSNANVSSTPPIGTTASDGSHSHTLSGTATSAGGHTHTFTVSGDTDSKGEGTAHNNMQPYIVVYRWRRTA